MDELGLVSLHRRRRQRSLTDSPEKLGGRGIKSSSKSRYHQAIPGYQQ